MYKTIKSSKAEDKPPLTQVMHVALLFSFANSISTILGGFLSFVPMSSDKTIIDQVTRMLSH